MTNKKFDNTKLKPFDNSNDCGYLEENKDWKLEDEMKEISINNVFGECLDISPYTYGCGSYAWIREDSFKEFLRICEDICNLHNIKGEECWARIKERAGKSLVESK